MTHSHLMNEADLDASVLKTHSFPGSTAGTLGDRWQKVTSASRFLTSAISIRERHYIKPTSKLYPTYSKREEQQTGATDYLDHSSKNIRVNLTSPQLRSNRRS